MSIFKPSNLPIFDKSNSFIIATLEFSNFSIIEKNYDFSLIYQKIQEDIHKKFTIENIKDDPIVKLYRNFYWKVLHIDPTKIRPSSEALIRRILNNKNLPKISPFVDSYNWGSVFSQIPMGAYDRDKLSLPITIRLSKEEEIFHPIGKEVKNLLKDTLIISDNNENILCQYPYRDSQFTKVTSDTKNIILIACGVPDLDQRNLISALEVVKDHLDYFRKEKIIQYSTEGFQIYNIS